MTEIERIADSLIRAVKPLSQFENIRFIKAYNHRTAEKPASGILAVVEIRSVEKSGNNSTVSKVIVRLVAGRDVSGEELSHTALSLADAIKSADENNYVESTSVGESVYDKQISALCRDITLTVSKYSESAAVDLNTIYIGSEQLSGVKSIKVDENMKFIKLYEFHRAEPYSVISNVINYEITLETVSSDFAQPVNGFTLRIGGGSHYVRYTGCIVMGFTESLNSKGQIIKKIKMISERKVTV